MKTGNRCQVVGCRRSVAARGLCHTHHRQLLAEGEARAIRPYRKRSPGTVKVAGLRLSAEAADAVLRYARKKKVSPSAAIAALLDRAVRQGPG